MRWNQCVCSVTLTVTVLTGTSTVSATLVIDTFSGFQSASDSITGGGSVTSNAAVGGVFGGQRRLVADKAGPPGSPIAAEAIFTDGFGATQLNLDQFGTATGVFGTSSLIYDGDPLGSGTTVNPMIADTDLTINAHSLLLTDLSIVGDGIDLTIDVYDGANVSTYTMELANAPTPTDLYISYSLFSDPTVFTSVNAIAMTFDGLETSGAVSGRGSDLSFSALVATVPEPSSLGMAGLACAGLFYSHRRRRSVGA